MCKIFFYAINNVLNENIIIFYFVIIIILSLKSQNAKKKYKEKIIRIKKPKKKVNADNNKENVYEKIILQDAEHDDNIDLDEVDQPR